MTKLPSFVSQWHLPRYLLWIILLLLISSACQPVQAPLTPAAFQTLPTVTPTSTESNMVPSPTVTLSPTATIQPIVTVVPLPLSQEGPWLVYKPYYPMEHAEDEYFIVNEDGTGREGIVADYDLGNIQESPFNHLVVFPGRVYLFESAQMDLTLVYSDWFHSCWPSCRSADMGRSDHTGNNEKGLLAIMTPGIEEETPELLIYELPSGKIRDRFPVLFKCPTDDESCDTSSVEWWNFELDWSPNGRYLAFAGALENQPSEFGPSSDLYLYDAQTGNVLRLTSGPDSVAQISWSPDGQWIIMGELHESIYPYATSLWAVSAANHEMRKLYSLEALYPPGVLREAGYPQGILGWLDDRRFIVYGGTTLVNAFDLPVYGLHLVDIDARKATMLVDNIVVAAELDRGHETIVVHAYDFEDGDQGIFLVSTSNTKLRYVGSRDLLPNWNDELKLFVTEESCENDPQGKRAFDHKGEWQCIYLSWSDNFPSPDGQWEVSIQDGTWLKANDQQAIQIIQGNAVQVIWRPDSEGFFFVADQTLYYVSLPQATLSVIDQNVYGNSISYQWLDGN